MAKIKLDNPEKLPEMLLPEKKHRPWLKIVIIIFLILFVVSGAVFGGSAWYIQKYQNKIYPGVYAGHYHVGKMSRDDLRNFIETTNNRLAKEGLNLEVDVNGKKSAVKINTVSFGENSIELVKLDSYVLWQNTYAMGRTGNWATRLFSPLYFRLFNQNLSVPVKTDWVNLLDSLKDNLSKLVDAPRDAGIKITNFAPVSYEVVPESSGLVFKYEDIIKQIQDNLAELYLGNIAIQAQQFDPTIKTADVVKAAENLSGFLSYGDIGLNYVDPQTKIRRDWNLSVDQYSPWLEIQNDENNQPIFVLNHEKVKTYLEGLRYLVDKVPQDAKFSIAADQKVKEFQASQTGLTLNVEKTLQDLNNAFRQRNYHSTEIIKTVSLTVDTAEPVVKTANVNSLGIEDVIGSGYSTFKDSHTNRIKNIAHAVERLNGTLIKPDEEFSAIKYAGPFTAENGYLPEAVIKGTEIKNEIGGGMCQIGTTLFRMAMNSGMNITQRQNHSLVVSYYADPVNGNPGTDAALYEPILDLKFINDTGNYLLLQTDIDYKKQQLTFTLWGKPDGRKGWFTHPLVKKWIPYGDPQEIKTDKVKPGVTKCQVAYRGAVASFTYSRVTPSGEKIDRVFESYYRPLPKICMIGVDPATLCKPGEQCVASPVVNLDTIESAPEISAPIPTATTTN
ncbi:MAG: VanW family protein [Candidatus Magasanikbacteria bacterium]